MAEKEIMLHLASTRTLYATNVERLDIYRRSAIANIPDLKATPWNVYVDIEGVMVSMQLDTGPSLSLSSSQVRLCSYSSEVIPVLGAVDVNVIYKGQSHKVP